MELPVSYLSRLLPSLEGKPAVNTQTYLFSFDFILLSKHSFKTQNRQLLFCFYLGSVTSKWSFLLNLCSLQHNMSSLKWLLCDRHLWYYVQVTFIAVACIIFNLCKLCHIRVILDVAILQIIDNWWLTILQIILDKSHCTMFIRFSAFSCSFSEAHLINITAEMPI